MTMGDMGGGAPTMQPPGTPPEASPVVAGLAASGIAPEAVPGAPAAVPNAPEAVPNAPEAVPNAPAAVPSAPVPGAGVPAGPTAAAAPAPAASPAAAAGQAPAAGGAGLRPLELLHGVEMAVTVELGRTRVAMRDLLSLRAGSIVELDRAAGGPVDVVVNGTLLARGEVVVVDDELGVRITEVVGAAEER